MKKPPIARPFSDRGGGFCNGGGVISRQNGGCGKFLRIHSYIAKK